ncbi:hypothetical protein SAMN04515668_3604 [Hymenobacter arizonensis]|uniref:Uncharacterized protein n=1 Tax=Hymenobacter arizonensis TaxID=1227077 RepID=A0A1I6AEP5_HYMAR|nr:hypothetical protein SAMN04515668_3604 [Hymenobacter arizonensis]
MFNAAISLGNANTLRCDIEGLSLSSWPGMDAQKTPLQ